MASESTTIGEIETRIDIEVSNEPSAVCRQLKRAEYREVSRRGSHRTWKRSDDRKLFTIKDPGNGDVKPGYIRELVRRIDRIHAKEDAP